MAAATMPATIATVSMEKMSKPILPLTLVDGVADVGEAVVATPDPAVLVVDLVPLRVVV